MKHAFWDRLLIVLCSLLLLGLAALLLGVVVGFVPVSLLLERANNLVVSRNWRVILSASSAALTLLSVFVFWIVLPRRKGRFSTFAIQQTEHGTLKISVKALEHLVQKCISQHPELTIASSAIYSNEETVRVDLRLSLQTDINIPLAISSLQKQIKQYVEACSGVDVDEVRVVVESTVPPVTGTNSPFAIPDMLQPHLPRLPEGASPNATPAEQPPDAPVSDVQAPEQLKEPAVRAEIPDFPEDKDTAWMETEPVELSEGPGLSPAYQLNPMPEVPMPDWLLEREPGAHPQRDPAEATQDGAPDEEAAGVVGEEEPGNRLIHDVEGREEA